MDLKPPFVYRMVILMVVGACSPIIITTILKDQLKMER